MPMKPDRPKAPSARRPLQAHGPGCRQTGVEMEIFTSFLYFAAVLYYFFALYL